MMVVRNGEDYVGQCLSVIAPHVKRMKVAIDGRSNDKTGEIVFGLASQFGNIEISSFVVSNPMTDLVEMRNSQLVFHEEWGFIVDSDEYHQDIEKYQLGDEDAYGLQCWAVWNETHAHKQSSKINVGRFFRNYPDIVWKGQWGKEALFRGDKKVFEKPAMIPHRYIHFTHVKKDDWRSEMNQRRVADNKRLIRMPDDIIKTIKEIHHEKMPRLPRN